MSQPQVFKGIGICHMRRNGIANAILRDLGDVETLKMTNRSNSLEWKQHRKPGGGNLHKHDTLAGITLDVQMQEWTDENLALALQGKIVVLDSETVTGEEIVLQPGGFCVTAFPGPKNITLTKTQGSTPIALSAVEVSGAGVRVPADSTVITEVTPATIAYTSTAATRVEPLVEAGAEYYLLFDGLNETDGTAVIVEVWRWKAPPAEELSLIDGENPGKLLAKGEILADPSRPAGESPFWRATRIAAA